MLIAMEMPPPQNSRTFKEVFVSNFHNSFSFSDFLKLSLNEQVKVTRISDREIIQPSDSLKRILHFFVKNVFVYATVADDVVFSYRKGVNVRDAVIPHSKNKFFFQTDIANFFGSLTTSLVENALNNRLDNVPISDLPEFISTIQRLVTYKNSLPLGFPTSPAISNMCLFDFDIEMSKHCAENSVTFTRYADDIILSANDENAIRTESLKIESLLKELIDKDIELNRNKTRYLKQGQKIKLLGLVVLPNGQISIDKSDKNEIETMLHLYLSDDYRFLEYAASLKSRKAKNDMVLSRESAVSMLSGRLIGANAMAPEYVLKLRQKYGNTVIDMFLHKSAK